MIAAPRTGQRLPSGLSCGWRRTNARPGLARTGHLAAGGRRRRGKTWCGSGTLGGLIGEERRRSGCARAPHPVRAPARQRALTWVGCFGAANRARRRDLDDLAENITATRCVMCATMARSWLMGCTPVAPLQILQQVHDLRSPRRRAPRPPRRRMTSGSPASAQAMRYAGAGRRRSCGSDCPHRAAGGRGPATRRGGRDPRRPKLRISSAGCRTFMRGCRAGRSLEHDAERRRIRRSVL